MNHLLGSLYYIFKCLSVQHILSAYKLKNAWKGLNILKIIRLYKLHQKKKIDFVKTLIWVKISGFLSFFPIIFKNIGLVFNLQYNLDPIFYMKPSSKLKIENTKTAHAQIYSSLSKILLIFTLSCIVLDIIIL